MVQYRYRMVRNGEYCPFTISVSHIINETSSVSFSGQNMKMFLGEYNPNLTEGSRIALPKKMREQIESGQVVLTKGFEKCVYVFDKTDWLEQSTKQIENSSLEGQGKIRDLERYIYASAVESNVDSQGRFVVPSSLSSYAEINEETTVVGVGNRIELWSKDNWEMYKNKISAALSN